MIRWLRSIAMLVCFALAFVSCKKESVPVAPAPGSHAPSSVKPGSYEDWCEEHQVPESLCTRCDPSLAAAFQASGDWCKEHGLPESQCRTCNPGLQIVRPPKTREK
jgi:hypothetical protein